MTGARRAVAAARAELAACHALVDDLPAAITSAEKAARTKVPAGQPWAPSQQAA